MLVQRGSKGKGQIHRLKDAAVGLVIDSVPQGKVDGVLLALAVASVTHITCPGEVLSVLVKGARHHTISGVEGLLNSISVVDVDVDVQDTLVVPIAHYYYFVIIACLGKKKKKRKKEKKRKEKEREERLTLEARGSRGRCRLHSKNLMPRTSWRDEAHLPS